MVLSYARNKYATAIDLEDGSLLVRAAVEDTFFSGAVEMEVKVPDLEIGSIKGEIKRAFNEECQQAIPLLEKAVGLRVGTGVIRAVNDLIGGSSGCPRLADLILECVDEVVLRFTYPSVRERQSRIREIDSKSWQERIDLHKEAVRQNPRLVGSCIAFAEGSSLLEGLELEK